nr:hypothetical protein HK105_007489 [Polyrhizophydium stewartii]
MSPGTHRSLTAQISKQTGASIFVPDYRLAPETPFPAAVEDAVACYTALTGIDHGYDFQALWVSDADPLIVPKLPIPPRRVVVMGDSSGGGLSVQFLNALKLMDIPTVAGAVLISPFLDVDLSSASWHTNWNTDYLTFDVAGMRWLMGMYCNGLPRTDPAVAPLHGDLSGLPPILIQAGASEMLRDDSIRFQARAILHGSAVKLELFRGMFHVFQAFLTVPRESQEAIRRIAAFVKEVAVPFDRKDSGMQIDAVDAVSNTSSQDTSAAATQQTHAPTEHLTQIYLGSSSAQRPQSALQRLQEREALKATSGTPVYGISPSPRPPNPIITLVSVTPTGVTEEQLHSNVIY